MALPAQTPPAGDEAITGSAATTDPADTGQATNPDHVGGIDALRGAAAVIVVLYHILFVPCVRPRIPLGVTPVLLAGGAGVQLFFLLSAFTLCLSWHGRNDGVHRTRNFLLRRAFRIGPLFYAWLAVAPIRVVALDGQTLRWKVVIANVLVLYNFVPGISPGLVQASWTIGVEVLFYAAFPLLASLALTVRRAAVGLVIAGLIAVGFLLLVMPKVRQHPAVWGEYYDYSIARAGPVFLAGMVTYAIHRRWQSHGPPPPGLLRWFTPAAAATFVGLAYSGAFDYHLGIDLTAVCWSLLVLGFTWHPRSALVNPATRFLGRVSYSLYLDHPLVLLLLTPAYAKIYAAVPGRWPPLGVSLLLTLGCLIPVASLTYRFIEQPGMRLGSRLIKRLT